MVYCKYKERGKEREDKTMTKREQKGVEKSLKKRMTKKQLKELHNQERTRALFNTGTRTMKSAKDYDRAKSKREARKALEE